MKTMPFPEFRQTFNYDCGAKALQAVLVYYGFDVNEKAVMDITKTNRSGTLVSGLKKAIRHFGLKCISKKMDIESLRKFIDKKIPVIIPLQAWTEKEEVNWEKDWKDGHYVVVIGYDADKFIFEDPSSSVRTFLNFDEFLTRWHDIDAKGKKVVNYGIAIFGKKGKYTPEKAIHMG